MKTVVIVQRRLTDYRTQLFELMRERLAERDIRLRLMVGQSTEAERLKRDGGDLEWAEPLPTRYWLGGDICWQPFGTVDDAKLVIVTQENKLLYNHWLLVRPRSFKLAFWGHGRNMQADGGESWRERFKRWTACQADWWFAYTDLTRRILCSYGISDERITVVNNAIDISATQNALAEARKDATQSILRQLGLTGKRYAIYVGSLYQDKRLGFVVEAMIKARSKVPNLELVIMGDGPDREQVGKWCMSHPWIRWVGARKGVEKAQLIDGAMMMLNPGAVGLVVLDAFVFGKVLVTLSEARHGPEIAYLKDGINGIVCQDSVEIYVRIIEKLASDEQFRRRIERAAESASAEYTLDLMSERFCSGIERCIA